MWGGLGFGFAAAGGPLGFDFYGMGFAGRVVVEAAPPIMLGFRDQAARDGVLVDVMEFFCELLWAGYVEVVVAALPELFLAGRFELAGGCLLEDLEEGGQGVCCGFVGEEMDVLGHEDVGGDVETLLFAGFFEDLLESVFRSGGLEEGLSVVTTEGDEVKLVGLLEAFEARWHGGASSLHPTLRRGAKDGAPDRLWLG